MAREYTTIVLHIAADKTKEFETLFEREELVRWDDYTARGALRRGQVDPVPV